MLDDDVLDRFGVDTIELGRAFALDDADWADWTSARRHPLPGAGVDRCPQRTERGWVMRSRTGRVIAQMPDGALYFESTYFPFAEGEADHDDWRR